VVESLPLREQVANLYGLAAAFDVCGALAIEHGHAEAALRPAAAAESLWHTVGGAAVRELAAADRRDRDRAGQGGGPGPGRGGVWASGSRVPVADAVSLTPACLKAAGSTAGRWATSPTARVSVSGRLSS
jgi:hypothetical protein